MRDDSPDLELALCRFKRLMQDLERENCSRNSFHPWELELLFDMEQCRLRGSRRTRTLRGYEKATTKALEGGHWPPLKLSEYLAANARRREERQAQPY